VTRRKYDGFGRLRTIDGPSDADTNVSYTAAGPDMCVVTRANSGAETRVYIDRLGREYRQARKLADGTFAEWTTTFDPIGRPFKATGPYENRTFVCDELGRPRLEKRVDSEVEGGVSLVETRYQGYFKTVTFDETRIDSYVITDGLGQIIEKQERLNELASVTTKYEWKPFGLLGRVLAGPEGDRSETVMHYDNLGRREELWTPDTGRSTTRYNGFGEIRTEQDAEGRVVTFDYDGLGRTLKRTDLGDQGGETRFHYDTAPNGIGALARATSPDGVVTVLAYEGEFGALRASDTYVPGEMAGQPFRVEHEYDSLGRIQVLKYPQIPGQTGANRFAIRYEYDQNGGLLSTADAQTGAGYWRAESRDSMDRILDETFGKRAASSRRYYEDSGRLKSIKTGTGTELFQDLSYSYWSDGNLKTRRDHRVGLHEGFAYDALKRLGSWYTVAAGDDRKIPGFDVTYIYDERGNLRFRSNLSPGAEESLEYRYERINNAGPHAVTCTSLWRDGGTDCLPFEYDRTGNVIKHPLAGTITYTPFGLPKTIDGGPTNTSYLYDAFQSRTVKTVNGNRTVYIGGVYERRGRAQDPTHVFYVSNGERVVAQVTQNGTNGDRLTTYLHSDSLTSTDATHGPYSTTTTTSPALTRTKRDPFGNQIHDLQNGQWDVRLNGGSPVPPSPSAVTLGFTGHEEDSELGLINMQGRIYDARLGRFLQADPILSAPFFSQGNNRYAYVFNNPLRFVDPGGFQADCTDRNITRDCQNINKTAEVPVVITEKADCSLPQNYSACFEALKARLGISSGDEWTFLEDEWGFSEPELSLEDLLRLTQSEPPPPGPHDAALRAALSQTGNRFASELRQNPLFVQPDSRGFYRVSDYWVQKLQPFYANRDLRLGDIRVRLSILSGSKEGKTGGFLGGREMIIDSTIAKMPYHALKTFLHESMHMVQMDRVGRAGATWRSWSDTIRFGFSEEAQYEWSKYPSLHGVSFESISATGGGAYPLDAGFNRFAQSVLDNLSRCGGICDPLPGWSGPSWNY
jgi:RHS repeat-associated protein